MGLHIPIRSGACVYFVEGAGLVKIGVTSNLLRRMREFAFASPVPLSLVKTVPGGVDVEQALHSAFAEFRRHGEWFALPDGWCKRADRVVGRGTYEGWDERVDDDDSIPLFEANVALSTARRVTTLV